MNEQLRLPMWTFWLGVFLLGVLLAWNNVLTASADLFRNQVPFKPWQPYVWEFSSFFSTFLLYFGIYWLANKAPLLNPYWLRNLAWHLLASVVFSLLHVLLMVWLRQVIYFSLGYQYDFGDWFSEWLYEYRKDVITYFVFLVTLYAFQFFTQSKQTQKSEPAVEKLQVKNKQGIFWVNYADITTIESGGNYIYIHANDQVLPMRSTMADVEQKLSPAHFIRVHRSYVVNLNQCKALQKQSSDSSELILNSGKIIPVSKKYRGELMRCLQLKNQ